MKRNFLRWLKLKLQIKQSAEYITNYENELNQICWVMRIDKIISNQITVIARNNFLMVLHRKNSETAAREYRRFAPDLGTVIKIISKIKTFSFTFAQIRKRNRVSRRQWFVHTIVIIFWSFPAISRFSQHCRLVLLTSISTSNIIILNC